MMCELCGSGNKADFSAEIHIHFPLRKDLVKPGVFLFPKVLICLNCGALSVKVPENELRELAASLGESGHAVKANLDSTSQD